ncbi:MAG: hypothetical protein B2I17_01695 [Thermoplasmatales archaeon B_DKE]|nr:MAG: hypothetical protein B2I17_01695 [Thermoplasmatales archaeon B_DKE]
MKPWKREPHGPSEPYPIHDPGEVPHDCDPKHTESIPKKFPILRDRTETFNQKKPLYIYRTHGGLGHGTEKKSKVPCYVVMFHGITMMFEQKGSVYHE